MKKTVTTIMILTGTLIAGGCATKKYVEQTTTPIQAKIDQVADLMNKQGAEIDVAKKDIARHETDINAAKERAISAETAAGEAMNRATEAGNTAIQARNMAVKNAREGNALRESLGNLDDYKLRAEAVVPFGFNKDALTSQAQQQLDQFLTQHSNFKRYFIAIEGFTDRTGTNLYNDALSRRRADRVVTYLVVKHNVPVYRIQMIGLGKEKPADTGRNRAARAKNRRVEVRLFSADHANGGTEKD